MQLALGTVQFGTAYGIANRDGRPDAREIAAILRTARECGIDMLDTAPSYGDCEAILGRADAARAFRVVTKTPYSNGGRIDVEAALARSLADLGTARAHALLIHSVDDATGSEAGRIVDELQELKSRGLVAKIGITVYDPDDIARFRFLDAIDVVQLPLNVLDQRFHTTGTLAALRDRGLEIHVRSAFLQGLLLMSPDRLPAGFEAARPLIARLRAAEARHGLSPLQCALAFLNTVPEADYAVVGVDRAGQLREIAEAAVARAPLDFAEFACPAAEIVDPRRWPNVHA